MTTLPPLAASQSAPALPAPAEPTALPPLGALRRGRRLRRARRGTRASTARSFRRRRLVPHGDRLLRVRGQHRVAREPAQLPAPPLGARRGRQPAPTEPREEPAERQQRRHEQQPRDAIQVAPESPPKVPTAPVRPVSRRAGLRHGGGRDPVDRLHRGQAVLRSWPVRVCMPRVGPVAEQGRVAQTPSADVRRVDRDRCRVELTCSS